MSTQESAPEGKWKYPFTRPVDQPDQRRDPHEDLGSTPHVHIEGYPHHEHHDGLSHDPDWANVPDHPPAVPEDAKLTDEDIGLFAFTEREVEVARFAERLVTERMQAKMDAAEADGYVAGIVATEDKLQFQLGDAQAALEAYKAVE